MKWKGRFPLPYHVSAAAVVVFTKDKIREEFSEKKWRTVRRKITEDIYIVLDITVCKWRSMVGLYKGLYAKESGRRLSGQAFCEEHSAIPTEFIVPISYFAAFIDPEHHDWPETKVERHTNYPREREDWEMEQLHVMHEMVKKGMVLASQLNATLEPLARNDEDRFSAERLFYEAE